MNTHINIRTLHFQKLFRKHLSGIVAVAGICITSILSAANISSNWTGDGDGISWGDSANWDSTAYPNDGDGDIYHSYITNGNSSLMIQTPGNLILSGFTLTQEIGGSTTLKLGGNIALNNVGFANNSGIINNTGNPNGVTIDLNGFHFTSETLPATYHNFHTGSYTVGSSHADGTGTYSVRNIGSSATPANIVFNDSITVRLFVATPSFLSQATWAPNTTLHIVNTGNHNVAANTTVSLGNLTIGDIANTSSTTVATGSNSAITVRGNVIINTFTGASEGEASRISFSTNNAVLRVMGSFTDQGTDSSHYGSNTSISGTIIFAGGANDEKTVSIGRQSLRNHFQVGDVENPGNITLGNHLNTVRNIRIQGDSRVNVNEYSLNAGDTLEIEAGAQLALQEGGVFNANTLILDSFHLELLGDWSSWNNGDDLLLFTYTNLSNTSTPSLASVSGPAGLTYDGLIVDSGNIWLSNVAIPEPQAISIFVIALGLIISVKRFKKFRS